MNLQLGDCLDVMKELPGWSIDLVLADPPYGTTQSKWDSVINSELLWKELKRVAKPSAAIVLFGMEPFSSSLRASNPRDFKYDWIWEKTEAKGHLNAKIQPLRAHEIISVFYEKQPSYYPQKTSGHALKQANGVDRAKKLSTVYGSQKDITNYSSTERYPRSVLKFKSDKQKSNFHPNQKPIALLEYLIKTYTTGGQVVLDFCMGSGSTGVACQNLGRKFIGIEKDQGFFEIAKNRLTPSADGAHSAERER